MSVSDQIDMSALQSHHSDHCFQRMRLMTAYGTEFFSMNDVNRLRILQDVIDRRLTTRLAATRLDISERDSTQADDTGWLMDPPQVTAASCASATTASGLHRRTHPD